MTDKVTGASERHEDRGATQWRLRLSGLLGRRNLERKPWNARSWTRCSYWLG